MTPHRGWIGLAAVAIALATAGPARPTITATTRSRLALVDSLWSAGQRDSSQALITRWLPPSRRRADSALLCGLLVRSGAHLASHGEYRQAERALREALALAEARADSAVMSSALRWLSLAVGGQGGTGEARALSLRLQELARRRGDRRHEGWALVGLAWEASQAGRTRESVAFSRRAAVLFTRAGDAEGEIWARNTLGVALSALGDFRGAAACYRLSAAAAHGVGFAVAEAIALNNLGHLEHGLGDPGRALGSFRRALEIARRIGQEREAVTPQLNIAISLMELGRLDEAGSALDRCVAECTAQGYRDLQGMALYQSAELRRLQSRKHEAASLYRRALALGAAQTLRNRVECLIGLSDVLAGVDSAAGALAAARAAVGVLAGGEIRLMEPLARRALAGRLRESGDVRGSLANLLAADRAAQRAGWSGRRAGILALAARDQRELGRSDSARALLDRAAAIWEAERGVPLDPDWREQRGASGQMVFTDRADLALAADSPVQPAGRTAAAFDQLQRFKTRTLLERMRGPGGLDGRPATDVAGQTVTLSVLQQQLLVEGDLLLDFHLGPQRSLLFAVTRHHARAVRLPGAAILEERLRNYRELLAAPGKETEGRGATGVDEPAAIVATRELAARAVSRLLFGEIEDLIGASRRVLVSADGAVNLLPLAELPGPDGLCRLEGRDWVRIPSATVLLRISERLPRARDTEDATILALADAEPLPGARREVIGLRRSFRHVRTEPPAVDPRGGAGALAGADLVHFAAHLLADDQHPWQSRLRLQAGDSVLVLEAAEVAGWRLPARMAVLSGCSSAGGRILSGEGVLGFSSALLAAGVPSVVATLWPVDDGATVLFMRAFYRELGSGRPAAEALHRAQDVVRSRPATREPRYWAGFVVIGDGGMRVPLPRRMPDLPLAACASILLGLVLGLAALRGTRGPST